MTAEAEALIPMAELSGRWAITPNTVSRRLAFLGIKPIRQGNYRFLTPEQVEQAQKLHDHILSGKSQDTFPRPDGDSSQVVRHVAPSGQVAAQVEIAAAMAAALQPAPDPLRRARGLAEAADHQLVLTTDELVALGVKGVEGFADGDEAFGYRFSKHRQRNRTLWTVERCIGFKTLKQLDQAVDQKVDAGRQVGFAAHLTSNTSGVSLFAATTIC
jgi:hypothetical protein